MERAEMTAEMTAEGQLNWNGGSSAGVTAHRLHLARDAGWMSFRVSLER
jgi:hypothetical protein